jgi:hyaluronate lyase
VYTDPDPDTDQESYGFSGNMNTSYTRLNTLAQAYCQPGTGLTGDSGLRDAVLTGLAGNLTRTAGATQRITVRLG